VCFQNSFASLVVINLFDFLIATKNTHTMDIFKIEKYEAFSFDLAM
jgi:hypothetical protein